MLEGIAQLIRMFGELTSYLVMGAFALFAIHIILTTWYDKYEH